MSLITVERIKLFSTRSPYWCLGLVPVLGLGITLLVSLVDRGSGASLETSQAWFGFARSVVMVMAALSITTEYRFGTIRSSFLAVPTRSNVLLAKCVLLAVISFVIVEITSIASYFLAKTVHGSGASDAAFAVTSAADYRVIWGPGVIAAVAAVLAIAVGTLVRQSAGAIAVVLLWPLLVENLFTLFGTFGRDVQPWLPFNASSAFVSGDDNNFNIFAGTTPTWWQGGLVFLGTTVVLLIVALAAAKRRDD
jgi:ABC-2 type transport system permease protein